MPEQSAYKRASAARRKISEINPEKDIRVSILGRVVDRSDGSVVIDDGSGTAEVIVEQAVPADVVRIIARVLPLEDRYELRAEIVQDMSTIDMGLYRKVFE